MRASAQGDVAEQLVLKREEQYLSSMVHTKVIYDRNNSVWNTILRAPLSVGEIRDSPSQSR